MKRFIPLTSAMVVLSCASNITNAETTDIDPGDMTRVYSQLGASVDSDSNIKLLGSVSGTYSGGDSFLLYGEAVFGDTHFHDEDYGVDYSNARFQYFQVKNTEFSMVPKLGLSIDAIHSRLPGYQDLDDDMSLVSAGLVAMINPEYTGSLMVFPNLAYTTGELYARSVDGAMVNLFLTKRIAKNRAYIGFFPEYMRVSGDGIERESVKLKFQVGTPISDSQRLWMMTTYEHQESTLTIDKFSDGWNNASRIELGFKYYL